MTDPDEIPITFDLETETMEADFSGVRFADEAMVHAVYDRIERLIADSGDDRWYFLVNLQDMRIEPGAWMAYGKRGRRLNEAHSLGSVRFDASDDTKREIKRRAESEDFDANLFDKREGAVARIAYLRSIAPRRFKPQARIPSKWGVEEFARRVTLDRPAQIMEADFSDFVFEALGDVHDFYDYLDHQMRQSGVDWFFLVNYHNTRIMPEVWGAYAARGKKLNQDFAIASVRYDPSEETAREIARRAGTESFDPNLFSDRDAALARIAEIKAEMDAKRAG